MAGIGGGTGWTGAHVREPEARFAFPLRSVEAPPPACPRWRICPDSAPQRVPAPGTFRRHPASLVQVPPRSCGTDCAATI